MAMLQNSKEVVDWINNRIKLGMKPGLKRMEWMMKKLDHPERLIRTVHIGGTNGKGSTTAFLRSILQNAGYDVGTFTSPYFETFNERISVNGKPIDDEHLIQAANVIKPLAEELDQTELGAPTEFEIITAIGIYYFAKINRVDLVLFEVGLGGRLDSTNIIHPMVSIITNIGFDHMNILGSTLAEIAFEKAGIIKNGVPVITGATQREALEVIKKTAEMRKSPLYVMNQQFFSTDIGLSETGETFSLKTMFQEYSNIQTAMLGKHQIDNAALSIMAAEVLATYFGFYINEDYIKEGVKQAYWPGRFEILSDSPKIIIDGAHNKEGVESFSATLKRHFPNKKGTILFTALKDKQLDEMIQILDGLDYRLVFTEFAYPRAARAEELINLSNAGDKTIAPDWQKFLSETVPLLQKDDLFIVTGSLYFISEVKPFLMKFIKIGK